MRVRRVVSIWENNVSQSTVGRLQPAVFRANINEFFRKSTTKPWRSANQGMLARSDQRRGIGFEKEWTAAAGILDLPGECRYKQLFLPGALWIFQKFASICILRTDLKIWKHAFQSRMQGISQAHEDTIGRTDPTGRPAGL
ncbi:MAG TPA: hypothetical protein ACFCUC_05680 [Desulfobacterales bacterium]